MGPIGKYQRQANAYEFFTARAADGRPFTAQDIADYCGWDVSTPKTYITKKWKDFLAPASAGHFTVRPEFARVSKERFLSRATQKEPIYTGYIRTRHDHAAVFELRLALTGEVRLKESLDELLFADGLENRIREIGLDAMERLCPRSPGVSDDAYVAYLVDQASVFRGYTINRERVCLRTAAPMSRAQAGARYADGGRYLVDGAITIVKFTVPCATGSDSFEDTCEPHEDIHAACPFDADELDEEVRRIRGLFFLLFVEAIVRTAESGDDIWLIESGVANRIYHWSTP